ncbi:MAG: ABC transporter substrate-binding protein, partial [Bacteroidota bacterium]
MPILFRTSLLTLFLIPCFLDGQTLFPDSLIFRPEVERVFVEGMKHFREGAYDSASVLFIRVLRDSPANHRMTGAAIMGGKSLYRLGRYRDAVRVLKDLIDRYPESAYVDDAHYTLGLCYYRVGRYEDAGLEFLTAHQETDDTKIRERAERLLDALAGNNLSATQLEFLLSESHTETIRALLSVRLAELLFRGGDLRAAQELLRPVSSFNPAIRYVSEALDLLERIERGGIVKIGVVLPLMLKSQQSDLRDLGLDMLEGIRIAVQEYNERAFPRVTLEVRDSERDPGVAARQVTELASDDRVVAIIGPLFSNEAFASAGIAGALGVPLLSPTATANGIASIGSTVFQLNPDYDVRGRATARYAMVQLGMRRFAVLTPVDGPESSRLMSESFIAEVQRLGGEVVDQQWYPAGGTDLRFQMMTMRQRALDDLEDVSIDFSLRFTYDDLKKMLVAGVDPRVLDSLVETESRVPVEQLLGPQGQVLADSLGFPVVRTPVKFDSLAIPVRNLDGIFLPIAGSGEIGIVTSQLRYFNFQTQYLGTGEW